MVRPASSARRDPTDGCSSFHGRQLSRLTPRSVTRAGGGLLDGKDALFRMRAFNSQLCFSPSWVIGFTPSEPPSGLKPLSLGLEGEFPRAREKERRGRQITHLFERERATNQYWGARGKRGAKVGDRNEGKIGEATAIGIGQEALKTKSHFLHLKV